MKIYNKKTTNSCKTRLLVSDRNIIKAYLREIFSKEIKIEIGDKLYSQEIALNKKLADQVSLFDSEYFSAFLKLLELQPNNDLKRIITAFLELLLGALGQNLVSQLNDELFEKAPITVNIFDDISGIFNINYSSVGQVGMEIVIEQTREKVNENTDINKIFIELGKTILEQIYCQTLDYQSLTDSHFRYLYNPKSQWTKFTKIAVFLYTVQRYIKDQTKIDETRIENGPGFYHDLITMQNEFDLHAVGTTNYNNFIMDIFEKNNIKDVSVLILCQENGQRKLRFRSESIALSLARLTNNLRGVTLKLFVRLKGVDYMTLAFCKTSKYCFSYATGDI